MPFSKNILILICFIIVSSSSLYAKSMKIPLHKPAFKEYKYSTMNKTFGVLSKNDIEKYQNIFHFQGLGKWNQSQKIINTLENNILMGHVLFQKYMHPTAYRSSYIELSNWLKKYSDHPGANRVYNLAKKRRPANHSYPIRPKRASFINKTKPQAFVQKTKSNKNYYINRKSKKIYTKIKSQIKKEILTKSEADIKNLRNGVLNEYQKDLLFFNISEQWYYRGDNDKKAFELSSIAAERSREKIPYADWIAGLSAWRLEKYNESKHHFSKLANSNKITPWIISSAAFWASRASLKTKDYNDFIYWLKEGSKYDRTFYGIICKAFLGKEISISKERLKFEKKNYLLLKEYNAIKRIIALHEIGEHFLADKEAFYISSSANKNQSDALIRLTNELNLPYTTIKLAIENLDTNNKHFDTSAFPEPDWEHTSKFILDKALIFAFIRQESRFNANAKSHAGARGLMQLMPRTASFIAKDRSLRINKKYRLHEPNLNLDLGQRYIRILMQNKKFENNLFLITAAYNAGPSNINKWLMRFPYKNDPFLFIESIPARETRIFIERVLTNFWIYRMRFDQKKPSLSHVIEGKWPEYISLD